MWVQKRHYEGGNILFMDGHVDLIREPAKLLIKYWEPDYDSFNPTFMEP